MLESINSNNLEYQKLSSDEMQKRGILGRLVGNCASFMTPTRNGRKYSEKLWENVFNNPIVKEKIDNGVCFGELGHPTDREETDMEKIAVCLPSKPVKGSDGKLKAVFDILDTPNGRILKSLCDYGSTLGVSSRGSGDVDTSFTGEESVNPDSYDFQGFDIVLVPAVKEARLQYVTESLDKTRYNKTLRQKLSETIDKASDDEKKVMNESLNTLGISLNESNEYKGYAIQNTDSGTIIRDSRGNIVTTVPADDDATEWIDDNTKEESLKEDNNVDRYKDIIGQDLYDNGDNYTIKNINLDNRTITAISKDNAKTSIDISFDDINNNKTFIWDINKEERIPFVAPVTESIDSINKARKELFDYLEAWYNKNIAPEKWKDVKKSGFDNDSYIQFINYINPDLDEDINQETDDINDEENDITVDNDKVIEEELQKALKLNRSLDEKITTLQEKLSVSYAKEMKLEDDLDSYKSRVIKLSEINKENKALSEKLSKLTNEHEKLNESIEQNSSKEKRLSEALKSKDNNVKHLESKLNIVLEEKKEAESNLEKLEENFKSTNMKLNELKEKYSSKLESQNNLIEKYQGIARNAVNRYINNQATRLGIKSVEIKNRLPESYTFKDIDSICEDLQEYKINVNSLPFNTQLNENIKVSANHVDNRTLVQNSDDQISDYDLKFAEMFK